MGFDYLLADKLTTGIYNFVSLVKTILLGLSFVLSVPAADKMQPFVCLNFNSALQLVNGKKSPEIN